MSHVLRIRRTDKSRQDFVLLHSRQTGSALLDLELVGTDGINPFVARLKQQKINNLKSQNYNGTDDDWASVLCELLLQHRPQPDTAASPDTAVALVQGLEAVASVAEDATSITIVIRKNISGITQRLGAISLLLDEEIPIELFDWAGQAAQSANDSRTELLALRQAMLGQQSLVQRLNDQLDDLVRAKKEHESELLKKFAVLLNSKKLKIRDQQRLLAHAKVDTDVDAIKVDQTRLKKGGKPGQSRPGKRKANTSPSHSDDDDNSDDDNEPFGDRTLIDGGGPSPSGKLDIETTEDDGTDAEDFAPARPSSQAKTSTKIRRPASSRVGSSTMVDSAPRATTVPAEDLAAQPPPPRRELPFAAKTTESKPASHLKPPPPPTPVAPTNTAAASSAACSAQDDETEDETDDEL